MFVEYDKIRTKSNNSPTRNETNYWWTKLGV